MLSFCDDACQARGEVGALPRDVPLGQYFVNEQAITARLGGAFEAKVAPFLVGDLGRRKDVTDAEPLESLGIEVQTLGLEHPVAPLHVALELLVEKATE